jgi:predicted enzyme related to lactoylglutathione lyase
MAKKKSAKSRKPTTKKSGGKGAKNHARKAAKAAPRRAKASKPALKARPVRSVEPPPPPPPRPVGPAVVHWEVQARDPLGQIQFFSELFGWTVDANNEQQYGMVQPAGAGSIGGGIGAMLDAPRTTFYVEVPDINATLVKAEAMGAQTILPRTDMGMIVMGQFRDREGNLIGLVEPQPAAPV